LGRAAVRTVACTADGRMDADALRAGIAADRAAGARPFLAVATAGTTAFGALDPLESLAAVCAQEKLWLHVDAAWGGAWALVPRVRRHFAGLERADSLTWDAHKALQVPMGAGMFFARNAAPVREAFGVSTGYMPVNTPGALDPHQNTMQWSRRAIGMKVLASLATAGLPGTIAMLERMAELGDRLRALLRADGWTIAHESPLPIACFSRPELGTAEAPVRAAAAAVVARGRCFVAPARMPDGSWRLRVCITSFLAEPSDLELLIAELRAATV
jgi:aromatic-L-amino-acid/L-tryptophan decarboxylase